MKRITLALLFFVGLLFFPFQALSQAERIISFSATITLATNSTFIVEEQLVYDFGNLEPWDLSRYSVRVRKGRDELQDSAQSA